MTVPEFAELRAQRREAAVQLRAQGMPVREIAGRLGVSHPTVIADLRESTMTTTTAAPVTTTAPFRSRHDERDVRLRLLLDALDQVGLPGTLEPARSLLGRAAEVMAEQREDHIRARAERDELVGKVAAGTLPLDRAVTRVAELAAWLTPTGGRADETFAHGVAERVAAQLRGQARDVAKATGMDVHAKLAKLAAGAAKRGAEAGRHLIDVDQVLGALRPPKRAERQIMVGGSVYEQHDVGVPLAPDPPRGVTLEQIQHDPAAMAHWATATTAAEQYRAVLDTAELLHGVAGGASTPFNATADTYEGRYAMSRIVRFLPAVQVHLAVFDALGWAPGLHLSLKPGERRPPERPADRSTRLSDWLAWQSAARVGPNLAG
jgi:hypothetical protein